MSRTSWMFEYITALYAVFTAREIGFILRRLKPLSESGRVAWLDHATGLFNRNSPIWVFFFPSLISSNRFCRKIRSEMKTFFSLFERKFISIDETSDWQESNSNVVIWFHVSPMRFSLNQKRSINHREFQNEIFFEDFQNKFWWSCGNNESINILHDHEGCYNIFWQKTFGRFSTKTAWLITQSRLLCFELLSTGTPNQTFGRRIKKYWCSTKLRLTR